MKASDFEYRHHTLVHQFIVVGAFLTYLLESDDIVWYFVKQSVRARALERVAFVIATLLIAFGASICTWARACRRPDAELVLGPYRYFRYPRHLGEVVYAVGLGSLAPLSGFVILVAGEVVRVICLIRRENDHREKFQTGVVLTFGSPWGNAFRQEAAKWCVLLTMIVFVITLKDRIAEILLVASVLIGLLCSAPVFSHSPDPTRAGSGD